MLTAMSKRKAARLHRHFPIATRLITVFRSPSHDQFLASWLVFTALPSINCIVFLVFDTYQLWQQKSTRPKAYCAQYRHRATPPCMIDIQHDITQILTDCMHQITQGRRKQCVDNVCIALLQQRTPSRQHYRKYSERRCVQSVGMLVLRADYQLTCVDTIVREIGEHYTFVVPMSTGLRPRHKPWKRASLHESCVISTTYYT